MTPTQTQILESARKAVELAKQEMRECADDTTKPWEYQNTLYALHFHLKDNFAPQAADYILESIPREERKDEALKVAMDKLRELATNELSEENCVSVELAGKRVRNHANQALVRITELLKTP